MLVAVRSSVVMSLLVGALVGCGGTTIAQNASTDSGTDSAGATDAGTTPADAGADTFVPAETFTVNYPPQTIAPGAESTMCVVLPVNNPTAVHIGRIHNTLTEGSHHLIVYKTDDTAPQATPFACQPFADLLATNTGTPLMITQKLDDVLEMPPTVGVTLTANQYVRLEFHTINTTSAPLTVTAAVELDVLPDSLYQNEEGFFFMGDPDIKIPAHSSFTLGPVFSPVPELLSGVNWFGITGHEHHWGTNVQVWSNTAPTGGTQQSVYSVPDWNWASPTTVWATPAFLIPDGGGFTFQCDWQNDGDTSVSFGESATNEMCFFWAYYWPAQTAQVCVHTMQTGSALDVCCPDASNPICAYVQSKLGGS